MKKLFTALFVLISYCSFGQLWQVMPQYGYSKNRDSTKLVLRIPSDTTNNKSGVAQIGATLYAGNGTYWTAAAGGGGGSGWNLTGNAGTTAGTNFIGTTDNVDLVIKANSIEQIRFLASGGIRVPATTIGDSTIGVIFKGADRFIHNFQLPASSTTLGQSLYIGRKSGNFTMTGSTGGFGTRNTAVGDSTLFANTTGYRNTVVGTFAGAANTTGFENTIVGANASQNSTSRQNTAIGAISMNSTTTGERNVALGFSSLQTNTTGSRNTALGSRAMQFSGSSFANVAVGFDALAYASIGDHNTAMGLDALYYSDGTHNVAIGDSTLWGLFPSVPVPSGQKHMGYKNVALGSRAGYHLGDTYPNFASIFDTACVFLGGNASRDSSIPYTTSLQNMTVIGYDARGLASNQVVLGNDNVTTTLLKGNVGIGTTAPDSLLTVELGVWGKRGVRFSGLPTSVGLYSVRADVDGNLSLADTTAGGAGSGTVNSGTQYRLGYYATTGTAISEAAAITANRALISDANGVPTHSTTTATQVGLLDIATGRTGTANIVYSNSAALVTPNIGVASGTSVTLSSLTANRIPIIGTSGLITDANAYTWTPATSQVNLTTTATAGGFNLTGNDPRYNITSTSSATAAGYVMTNSSADQGSLFIGGSTIAAPFTRAVGFFINATNGFKIYSAGISGVTFAAAQSGVINVTASQYIGSATTAPTALLHIKAGTSTASTAPLKFTSGVASQTVKEAGAINYDGSDLTLSDATYAYTLSKTLNGSATLDFGNTTAQTSTDLTITVTGAADGDVVMLGAPNGSVSGADNVVYFAWVSAANTVTVRFSNNNLAAAVDPASGTFKVRVIK